MWKCLVAWLLMLLVSIANGTVRDFTWAELLAYNLLKGRVWVVVLAWVAIAPYVFFRLK